MSIYKTTTIEYDNSENFYSIILGDRSLTKTAATMSKEITGFIDTYKFETEKYLYVLINAMGAGEYYGSNKNGDSFPEKILEKAHLIHVGLDYGYKTFETNARLYKHHVNKDPKKAYGDVIFAYYNEKMHRPELIVRMSREKAPLECHKVENNEVLSTSMGTRVPYDICSICGNKAKTTKNYCNHLKYMMNKVLPDGRKVYAINPFPKFFDISMVFIPADVTSRVMMKIASEETKPKLAVMKKEVPADAPEETGVDDILERLMRKKFDALSKREYDIPSETINKMCKFPLRKILSTLAFSGIVPKPKEFQRIILVKMKKQNLADILDEQNVVFNEKEYDMDNDIRKNGITIKPEHVDDEIYSLIKDFMPLRSRWQPFLLGRLSNESKLANYNQEQTADNLLPVMLAVSGLYSLFRETLPTKVMSALAGMLGAHPVLAAGVVATDMATKVMAPLLETRTYSIDTQNAEELLKISSIGECMDELLIRKYPLKKLAQYGNYNGICKLGSLVGDTFRWIGKGYGGFAHGASGGTIAPFIRRSIVGLPILGMASGLAKVRQSSGQKTNFITNALADSPGLIYALTALGGHKVPALMSKFSAFDPILNTDEGTVKMIFDDGKLLDAITAIKLGKLF